MNRAKQVLAASRLEVCGGAGISIVDTDMPEIPGPRFLWSTTPIWPAVLPDRISSFVDLDMLVMLTMPRSQVLTDQGVDLGWARMADFIIEIDRPDLSQVHTTRQGEADFHLWRNRWGPTRTHTVAYQGHYARFVEWPHERPAWSSTRNGLRTAAPHDQQRLPVRMNSGGRYADERTFSLPSDWQPVRDEVLQVAKRQALSALALESSLPALASYYDRTGAYAGTLFMDAQPNDPLTIEASDLYAVTTLSMNLDARHGRLLLDEGAARDTTRQRLSAVAPNLSLTHLGDGSQSSAETLSEMYALHSWFRDLLGNNSNRWVTAAKICARAAAAVPCQGQPGLQLLGGRTCIENGERLAGQLRKSTSRSTPTY